MRMLRFVTVFTVLALASVAAAQPAPASRGFVEGGLAYGWWLSNSDFIETSNGTALDSPGASGPALDLTGGFAPIPGLYMIGDFQWAHASTIDGQNQDGDTDRTKLSYLSLAFGVRTTVKAGPGEVYAQLGLGVATPFETVREQDLAGGGSRTTTTGYNTGYGGRGEAGYHYAINDHLFIGGGVRVQAFATDNVGRTRTRVDQPSGNIETDTYSTNPDAGGNTRNAQALSVQDVRFRLSVGYRF